jgi:glycosyltransferase involved in cell wall biosynthesis
MRVLHFGRFAHQLGGVERHAHQLCQQLAAMGVDVTNLVAASDRKNRTFVQGNYTIEEAASFGVAISTAMAPMLVWRAIQLHRAKPYDIFHLHFPDPLTHLASMLLPSNVPRVITWHSDIVKQRFILKMYRPFQWVETMRAKALIAPTAAHYASSSQIPKGQPSERRHVIPFGMNYDRLHLTPGIAKHAAEIRRKLLGNEERQARCLVFTLGRHVDYKGIHVLIKAMQYTDAFLIVGGDGPLAQELKQLSQTLGLQSKIHFTGRISEEALPAHYHACDIFCLPSVTQAEAFGLVQLEAMACGKPVICTQLNNGVNALNPHAVTGLTVKPGDPFELAQAINTLQTDDGLRRQLGQQAQTHALVNYSLQGMGTQHIRLYEMLCAGKK